MRFKDKVAIVTGGSQGIGNAIATGLAGEGARVAIFARREEVLNQAIEEIKSQGGEAVGLKVDVTESNQVKDGVKQVMDRFGKVDILVSNAGGNKAMPFIHSTEELWDDEIALNYKAHISCCRAVLDNMVERRYGKIVFIASDYGRMGTHLGAAVYSGCKGGVIAFTRALASEMARHSINVNCVSPGWINSTRGKGRFDNIPGRTERAVKTIPLNRIGQPEELAAGVLFLVSDEASYITGQTLSVNGGLCMP